MGSLGLAALRIARSELGHGEENENNEGFHINKYRRGHKAKGSGSWCATFISWCLEQGWAALGNVGACPVKRSNGALQLANRCARYGKVVDTPQAGDIVLFKRRGGNHIAICSRADEFHFWTIDGNKGKFPAEVDEFRHSYDEKNIKRFIRLEK